jgi:hypothetical protein
MSSIPAVLDRTRVGDPVTRDALTIVPLLQETNGAFKHDYIPLGEALQHGKAKVMEISESGSVPTLAIYNDADVAIFILDGEQLIGAKQNRIVNLSILVPAKQKLPIPVSCVERGRWSYRTREFHASPYSMFAGGRAEQMSAVTMSLRSSGSRHADQHRVWANVKERAALVGSASPTEALNDAYEAQRTSMDDLLAGIAPLEHQVGAAFAVAGRVVGTEIFESPEVFAQYFGKVVRSYALDALVTRKGRDFEPKEVDELLADVRRANTLRFRGVGLGDDLRIEDAKLTGGALVLDDRLIHLAAFRRGT